MNLSTLKIPAELKKHARKTVLKRLIPCAVLAVAFAVLLLLFGNTVCKTDNTVFRLSFYIVVMLIPFVITGVPFKLIDKTYEGIIESVNIETTVDSDSSVKPSRERLYHKNMVYLTVKLPNGKVCTKKAYEGKANLNQHLETYKKGDRVFHLYGSKYTVVLPKASDSEMQCVVCGEYNKIENNICRSCAHTLYKA